MAAISILDIMYLQLINGYFSGKPAKVTSPPGGNTNVRTFKRSTLQRLFTLDEAIDERGEP